MIAREIINQSMEFILQHLEENLSVQEVAAQFHYSEYYFNRAFRKVMGESVYAFIKRQKLNQSAIEMKLNREKSVTDIGEKYGYSASNYSSAFKKLKNISPGEFRRNAGETSKYNPFHQERVETFKSFENYDQKMSIQVLEDVPVIYKRVIGNYDDLKEAWYGLMEEYIEELKAGGLMIERFYDDPKVVEGDKCICDLCISVSPISTRENRTVIKGGRFAVYRYEGKIEDIYGVLQGIYCVWLPRSGYQMAGRCGLNIYRAVDKQKDTVTMDLCIPVK